MLGLGPPGGVRVRRGVSQVQAAFVTSLVTVHTKRLNFISRAVPY